MEANRLELLTSGATAIELTAFVNAVFADRARMQGWKSWVYEPRHLMSMIRKPAQYYSTFEIPKKSGGLRKIDAPRASLKRIQWSLIPVFNEMFHTSEVAFGFVRGRGIKENATFHLGQPVVLNVDIEGFFPSIREGRLVGLFTNAPGVRASHFMARSIARLCSLDGRLPQGSPASPVLTNFVAYRLDARLAGLARRYGCRYSRYVDDITFSGSGRSAMDSLFPELEAILKSEGFSLNADKTRLQTASMRREVTGLVLSSGHGKDHINTRRQYRREVRAMLYSWAKWGLASAARRNGFEGLDAQDVFVRHLHGRIAHMLHVYPSAEVCRMQQHLHHLLK